MSEKDELVAKLLQSLAKSIKLTIDLLEYEEVDATPAAVMGNITMLTSELITKEHNRQHKHHEHKHEW